MITLTQCCSRKIFSTCRFLQVVSGKIKQKYRLKMVFSLPVLKYFYLVLSYFKILKSFEKTKNGEIFLVKLFLKTNLTEVSLSDCPVDHAELHSRSQYKENWQEPVDSEDLFTRDSIQQNSERGSVMSPQSHLHDNNN